MPIPFEKVLNPLKSNPQRRLQKVLGTIGDGICSVFLMFPSIGIPQNLSHKIVNYKPSILGSPILINSYIIYIYMYIYLYVMHPNHSYWLL